MVPRVSGTTEQNLIRNLHEQALFAGLDPKTARMYLMQAFEGYDTPFDQGRAARDLGKLEFCENNPNWDEWLQQSVRLLEDALHETDFGSEEEARVLREQAATNSICGRVLLSVALYENDPVKYQDSVEFFRAAKEELKKSTNDNPFPDQYEINFSAAHVIAERYNGTRRRALRALGRTALIAPLSESSFVRHHREGISYRESFNTKRQAIGRAAFAAIIALRSDKFIQKQSVRIKASKMVV